MDITKALEKLNKLPIAERMEFMGLAYQIGDAAYNGDQERLDELRKKKQELLKKLL